VETAIVLEKRQQSRLFVYDVDTDEWERLRDLPVALLGSAVVGFGDRLYAIGGYANASEVPYSRVLSRTVYELRR
jgi:N-acetylneuraminic acid mutarotase